MTPLYFPNKENKKVGTWYRHQKPISRSLDLSIGVSSYVLRDMPYCYKDTGTVVTDSRTSPFSFTRPRRPDNDVDILMLTVFFEVSFDGERFK